MKVRVIIGANYGDEGKGRVTAEYTKKSKGPVLNVLTNGGAQRGHTVRHEGLEITNKHFGSGTIFGADNYFSKYFILCPMQFVLEYGNLFMDLGISQPVFYRHPDCLWSTPWDMMAGQIQNKGKFGSCGFGIWETILRYRKLPSYTLTEFHNLPDISKLEYIRKIKDYYTKVRLGSDIPAEYYDAWNSHITSLNFIDDCRFVCDNSVEVLRPKFEQYEEVIFENGQGLLLCDSGKDEADKTPSNTSSKIARELLQGVDCDLSLHYITRPYLTRHGFGELELGEENNLTSYLTQDTNIFNEFQGEFRYGKLDINKLKNRILLDSPDVVKKVIELTHCDEIDRTSEFRNTFSEFDINCYEL